MKRKMMAAALILGMFLPPLCAFPHREGQPESRSFQQKEQRSGSETSCHTVTSEQLEEINAVIDDLCDRWKEDVTGYEELVRSLCNENEGLRLKITKISERRNFWIKVSVCEALVIAGGAYCIYSFNK